MKKRFRARLPNAEPEATDPRILRHQLDGEPGKSSYVHMFGRGDSLPEFPLDVFPAPIKRYIAEGATALNVPSDMIAVPLLGFAAGAIGRTRAIAIKPGWVERANLWLAVIGDPGSGKSPANDYARAPLDALQSEAWDQFQLELTRWEHSAAEAKARKTDPPPQPVLDHYLTTDATIEALTRMLTTSPGVVVVRDELVGWVKSHDAYKRGGDRQAWLSLWAGAPLKVDRAGSDTSYVTHPVVPVVGAVQPDLLGDLADEAQRRDGFVERILMAYPVPRETKWNDDDLDDKTAQEVAATFRSLRSSGGASMVQVSLTPEARTAFGSWYEDNGGLIAESSGVAAGCYAKYPGQLARIALVLHALHHPTGTQVDVKTIADAIIAIEYFRAHLVRVLPSFGSIGTTKSAALATRSSASWGALTASGSAAGNSIGDSATASKPPRLTKCSMRWSTTARSRTGRFQPVPDPVRNHGYIPPEHMNI